MTIRAPYLEAFKQCLQSIQVGGKHEVANGDEQQGRIEIKSVGSFESFGEIIMYTLGDIDERHTRIVVTSKPSWSKTIEDWAKNEANVRQIKKYMRLYKNEKHSAF